MKKTFLALFILTGFCLFAQSPDQMSGVIRELSGTVELKASGAAAYVAAKVGDQVRQDTVVSTGFKSTALIEVGSTVLTVRPLTRLTLTEIRAGAGSETLNVNLQAGRVRVDVNPPAGTRAAMTVTSPVATASVRGTSFEFDTRNVYVSHGTVGFHGNRGKSMPVNAGSNGRVGSDGKAEDPIRTKHARLRPQPPVGTDPAGGSGSGTSSYSSGILTIDLLYNPDR